MQNCSKSQDSSFHILLSKVIDNSTQKPELFALLNLGIVQSLTSGALSADEAVEHFYHADNCLYVRKSLKSREASAIMSHGVQLPDLFDYLSAGESQREFHQELEKIRTLCLKLIDKERA